MMPELSSESMVSKFRDVTLFEIYLTVPGPRRSVRRGEISVWICWGGESQRHAVIKDGERLTTRPFSSV